MLLGRNLKFLYSFPIIALDFIFVLMPMQFNFLYFMKIHLFGDVLVFFLTQKQFALSVFQNVFEYFFYFIVLIYSLVAPIKLLLFSLSLYFNHIFMYSIILWYCPFNFVQFSQSLSSISLIMFQMYFWNNTFLCFFLNLFRSLFFFQQYHSFSQILCLFFPFLFKINQFHLVLFCFVEISF